MIAISDELAARIAVNSSEIAIMDRIQALGQPDRRHVPPTGGVHFALGGRFRLPRWRAAAPGRVVAAEWPADWGFRLGPDNPSRAARTMGTVFMWSRDTILNRPW